MRDVKVEVALVVIVHKIDTEGTGIFNAKLRGDFFELAVAFIVKYMNAGGIGHGQVRQTVVIVVAGAASQPRQRRSQPRGIRNILEMSLTEIAVERSRPLRILRCYVDIEETVTVDIEQTSSRSERAAQRRGRRTDLFLRRRPNGILPRQTCFGGYGNKMDRYRRRHQRH